jgi:hypothetical protein
MRGCNLAPAMKSDQERQWVRRCCGPVPNRCLISRPWEWPAGDHARAIRRRRSARVGGAKCGNNLVTVARAGDPSWRLVRSGGGARSGFTGFIAPDARPLRPWRGRLEPCALCCHRRAPIRQARPRSFSTASDRSGGGSGAARTQIWRS